MATPQGTTRSSSAQLIQMPQIPIHPAWVREVTNLTDVQISVLVEAFRFDGLDDKNRSVLERRTIRDLEQRYLLEFNEVAKAWRPTIAGATFVEAFCGAFGVVASKPLRLAPVLTFPSSGVSRTRGSKRG